MADDRAFLRFELGTLTAALPLACVREVLPMVELERPPRLSPVVEGLLDLGGVSYPVLRLDRLLEIPDVVPSLDSHLALTRGTELSCVLMIGRALGVDRVPEASLREVSNVVTWNGCVRAQYAGGVHVLDLSTLLAGPARALKAVA